MHSFTMTDNEGEVHKGIFLLYDEDHAVESITPVLRKWTEAYDEELCRWKIIGEEDTLSTADVIQLTINEIMNDKNKYGKPVLELIEGHVKFPVALASLARN